MSTDSDVVPHGVALPEIRALLGKLSLEAQAENSSRDAQMAILENILRAETLEEAFQRQEAGTVASKNFTLRPFRLLPENIDWKRSASGYVEQGGFPFYALLRVTEMGTGDELVVNTGSISTIGVLEKAIEFDDESRPIEKRSFEAHRADGGLPLQFVPKTMASGFDVILLMPVVTESKSKRGSR